MIEEMPQLHPNQKILLDDKSKEATQKHSVYSPCRFGCWNLMARWINGVWGKLEIFGVIYFLDIPKEESKRNILSKTSPDVGFFASITRLFTTNLNPRKYFERYHTVKVSCLFWLGFSFFLRDFRRGCMTIYQGTGFWVLLSKNSHSVDFFSGGKIFILWISRTVQTCFLADFESFESW